MRKHKMTRLLTLCMQMRLKEAITEWLALELGWVAETPFWSVAVHPWCTRKTTTQSSRSHSLADFLARYFQQGRWHLDRLWSFSFTVVLQSHRSLDSSIWATIKETIAKCNPSNTTPWMSTAISANYDNAFQANPTARRWIYQIKLRPKSWNE